MKGSTLCQCGCNMDVTDEIKKDLKEIDTHCKNITGKDITITSGARCEKYNASDAVKGNKKSAHIRGVACDISTPDSVTRFAIIEILFILGYKRFGWNKDKKFVHLDRGLEIDGYPQGVAFDY